MYRKRRERNREYIDVGLDMLTGFSCLTCCCCCFVVVVFCSLEPWCPSVLRHILWDGHCTHY